MNVTLVITVREQPQPVKPWLLTTVVDGAADELLVTVTLNKPDVDQHRIRPNRGALSPHFCAAANGLRPSAAGLCMRSQRSLLSFDEDFAFAWESNESGRRYFPSAFISLFIFQEIFGCAIGMTSSAI